MATSTSYRQNTVISVSQSAAARIDWTEKPREQGSMPNWEKLCAQSAGMRREPSLMHKSIDVQKLLEDAKQGTSDLQEVSNALTKQPEFTVIDPSVLKLPEIRIEDFIQNNAGTALQTEQNQQDCCNCCILQ